MPVIDNQMGRWRAQRLRRSTRGDAVALLGLFVLAVGTVVSGRRAALTLGPRSASATDRMIDQLELPTRLPDAALVSESGAGSTLLTTIHESRAAAAFYAPWCGPCQKELPELAASTVREAQLLVVISKDESVDDTRRQLTNIGLGHVPFYVDVTGRLFEAARVTALPTTLLLTRSGTILTRGTGYSELTLRRLRRKASAPADSAGGEPPSGKTP